MFFQKRQHRFYSPLNLRAFYIVDTGKASTTSHSYCIIHTPRNKVAVYLNQELILNVLSVLNVIKTTLRTFRSVIQKLCSCSANSSVFILVFWVKSHSTGALSLFLALLLSFNRTMYYILNYVFFCCFLQWSQLVISVKQLLRLIEAEMLSGHLLNNLSILLQWESYIQIDSLWDGMPLFTWVGFPGTINVDAV